MIYGNYFFVFFLLLILCSCANSVNLLERYHHTLYKIYGDSVNKLNEDQKVFAQEVENYIATVKEWNHKYDLYINSLNNEELKALSDLSEAYNQGDKPKYIMARRKLETLFEESGDVNKLINFKRLGREAGELVKKRDALNYKMDELENRRKKLVQFWESLKEMRRTIEEERRHQEMLSAIKRIDSGLDSLRFSLEQWRMQRWLLGR